MRSNPIPSPLGSSTRPSSPYYLSPCQFSTAPTNDTAKPHTRGKIFSHSRNSSFSHNTSYQQDFQLFKPQSSTTSNNTAGHRRGISVNRYNDPPDSSSSTRFQNMDLKESCEIPSTFRNELKGYMPYVQKPTFTAQFLKKKTETVANNSNHQQRLPTHHVPTKMTTRGSYRGDVSNPTVLYTFNKDMIDDKEPHELLNHHNTQRISVYDISMNYENGFGTTKITPNVINCQLPAKFSETIEDNETVPHLPCAGFIEVSPKHLETEERLPTDFVTDRYRSPSPSKRRQGGGSNDSPVINCQRRLEYSSKIITMNNVRISDQIPLQMSSGLMTFESVAFENKTNLAHLGGLNSSPNKRPLHLITNQKEQDVELESPHLDSEHIASISSPTKIKISHKRSMSSQPSSKAQKMNEVQLFKDRVYEYNQNGFDRYSQNNAHNQTYNVITNKSELENDTSMMNPHNACNSMEQGRNDNVNVSDILYQVKKFDKFCLDQSMEPTTHILEFEETIRQRPSTAKKSYDLPRQMGESSQKKKTASERKTEALLSHNQSSIINVSQEASDRLGVHQEQGSLIDFTLKTSERSQVKRDLCSQFLNRITEKDRSVENSHSTLNPSSTSILSFSKDGSGPSETQLEGAKCQASFNDMSHCLYREAQQADQEGSRISEHKGNQTKEISVVFAESKLLDNNKSHFESQILTASATLNTTDKSRKKTTDERCFGVPECQEMILAQGKNILEEESKTELSAQDIDHRNGHNPDLIAHIEYNYQPESYKVNEVNQSTSILGEDRQVYICKTLEEMDFADPSLIAIKSIENAKDLQSLVLNPNNIVKASNAEILRDSIPPQVQVQRVTQRPPLYMKSSFTNDFQTKQHHYQTKETATSLNSLTNLDEPAVAVKSHRQNLSFCADKISTHDFSLNLTQVPTIQLRRFSQTVETTTATKVLQLDFSDAPQPNEYNYSKIDLGDSTPKEKGPKRVAQLREKLCLAPIVLLSQHQEDLKSLRLASASPSPTKHESNLKQITQDFNSCTSTKVTYEKGSDIFKLYNTNFELQRIERKLAKYRDENTVTELKQKEQKVYSTASKTPLRADTGMNFSNISVGRSQTPNAYMGKSRDNSLGFLQMTGGVTASKGFKLKLHNKRR